MEKHNTYCRYFLFVLTLLISGVVNSQIKTPFTPRYNGSFRGDMLIIGNGIINRLKTGTASDAGTPNTPYNIQSTTLSNQSYNMQYINVDSDPTTYNSSSANLTVPDLTCSRIVYAGLYWSATYRYETGNDPTSGRFEDWNTIKFKVPGAVNYTNLTATSVIYNGFPDTDPNVSHGPYSCYADVTSLIAPLANPNGTYFAGNIRVSKDGRNDITGGVAGGWSLVIVFKNINYTSKNITTFDGHGVISSPGNGQPNTILDIPVTGFNTIPAGPVNAKIGMVAMEGDFRFNGDLFQIQSNPVVSPPFTPTGFINLTNTPPPAAAVTNNFFNSTITLNGANFTARNPNSLNTLGWDSHLNLINNPTNTVIPNNETGATLRATSAGDKYDVFFACFDIEVIAPEIPIIKNVTNAAGTILNGQTLSLGQTFFYTLTFHNTGNDNGANLVITDPLPNNIIFPPNGISIQPGDVVVPVGVTYTYNPTTKVFVFTVPNSLVTIGGPNYVIRIKARTPLDCNDVVDSCSNIVSNQAFSSYTGVLNTTPVTNNPSYTGYDTCLVPIIGVTNYLLDISACTFTTTEILCGSSLTLTAANGYSTYEWTNSSGVVIGNTQTITVSSIGVYHVNMTVPSPCSSLIQTFNVVNFNNIVNSNPVIPFADLVVTCPNNGEPLPKIFLCGANDSQLIQTNITTATSIIWSQLVVGSCAVQPLPNLCPNTNPLCTWNQVGTGPNYNATTAGQFSVTLTFQNGCFRTFYFNVYKNVLNPTIVATDIVCNTQGSITLNNVPAGYEFSLSPTGPWQTSNVFPINTAGTYTVYVHQTGVTNGCVFSYPQIVVLLKTPVFTITKTDKLCNNGFGSIRVQISNVNPQYSYQLNQGATVIATFGPSAINDYTFNNLNPGTYSVTATTSDGCTHNQLVTIANLSNLTLSAAITQNISCNDGSVLLTGTGGLQPYNYAIYSYNNVVVPVSSYVFQTYPVFTVPTGQQGSYQYIMVDANNCTVLSNVVNLTLQPTPVITNTTTNVTCNGLNNGIITVSSNITSGYIITYSIDGGVTFQSSNVFSGLTPGTYTITVKFKNNLSECLYTTTATITQPNPLIGQSQLVQNITCLLSGSIQAINVSGGTLPYQYSINGVTFQSSNVFANLSAGTYTITIKDAKNCTITTTPITLTAAPPITDLTFSSTNLTCPTLKSTITTSVVGGTAAYVFQIILPSVINATTTVGNTATFANLNPGTYTIKVTDSKGCFYQENYTINPVSVIDVTGNVVSNISCSGNNNGSIHYAVSGFNTNYSYSINSATAVTNQTNPNINLTNLPAGNYSITVTDTQTNCQDTFVLTLTNPPTPLVLNTSLIPKTCIANGSITATATGGWGSYQYTLTLPNLTVIGPQNSGSFTNLTLTGNYVVSVKDGNNCIITSNLLMNPISNPTITISASSDLCFDGFDDATIIVTAAGGTPPYQYNYNTAALQNSPIFPELTPGNYTITVTDSYGCTASINQVIAPMLSAQATIIKTLDCSSTPAANISVNINGGVAPYKYRVNINNGGFGVLNNITGNTFNYTTSTPGTYEFQISDLMGCVFVTNIVTIVPLTNPQITSVTQTQSILCNGNSTGAIAIVLNTNVGLSPYIITVLNTTTGVNYGNQTSALPAGNYLITVTDVNQCTDNETITITQPNPIVFNITNTDITCNAVGGTSFGEINVSNVTGGTQPLTYHLTNNFGFSNTYTAVTNENHTFTILNFGVYTVEVIDANGCSLQATSISIASPPNNLNINVLTPTTNCATGGTAIVTVTSPVSSGSYEFGILQTSTVPYALSFQPSDVGTPEISTFTGLTPGVIYTFVVHDLITNCYFFETANAPINTPSTLTNILNSVQNVTCTGSSNGNISFTFNNYNIGTTSVSYQIFNAQTNIAVGGIGNSIVSGGPTTVTNFGNLPPGLYYLLLTENGGGFAGCSVASTNFTIVQSTNLLVVNATLIKNDNCNLNAGIVSATAQYGTAPYQYQIALSTATAPTAITWSGSAASIFNIESGNYIVYVKDAYNCIKSIPVTVGLDPTPEITLSIVNPCVNEGSFGINVIRTVDGIAPYTYSIDTGALITQNANNFIITNLLSGLHTITITDSNGCGETKTITINQVLSGSSQVIAQPSCANNDGEIQAIVNNGSLSYSFILQNSTGTTIAGPNLTGLFNGLAAGNYTVVATDINCSISIPVVLETPTPVVFTYTQTNPICNGDANGSITVTLDVSNNNPPYTYTINDGINPPLTQNSPLFNNLPSGNYVVTVTSNRDCTHNENVILVDPLVLNLSATANTFTCNPNNTINVATITAVATNGTMPYLYSIDGINYQFSNTFSVIDDGTIQNFTVSVKDANNCADTFPIAINPLPKITATAVSQVTALDCANPESIEILITGGSGNYTYQLLPTGVITNVTTNPIVTTLPSPGTYNYEIVDTTTGCSVITSPYTINPLPLLEIVANPLNAVSCYGLSDGSLQFSVTNYTGNYNYQVFDANTGLAITGLVLGSTLTPIVTVSGLLAGNYNVVLNEIQIPLCSATSNTITIGSPALPVALTLQQTAEVTCTNDQGTIIATGTGGIGSYQYQVTNTTTGVLVQAFNTNAIITGLSAATYQIIVKDDNNCQATQNITLIPPTPINASFIISNNPLLCYGDTNASVTVTSVVGGQGVYQYALNNSGNGVVTGPQLGTLFDNLGAGTYTITVTDGWNCSFTTLPFTITQPTPITATLSSLGGLTCLNNATVVVTASGGFPPYSYSADGITFTSSNSFSVGPGTYQYYVSDFNNCAAVLTNSVTINPITPLQIEIDTSDTTINCSGETASITATATGGLGNYIYSLLNASLVVVVGPQSSSLFSNLGPGTYSVQVNSGDCILVSNPFTITAPTLLVLAAPTITNVSCNSLADGSITINASGGTILYQYGISPNMSQTTNSNQFTGLAAGSYTILTQDANGCYQTITAVVTEPPLLQASISNIQQELCEGTNSGSVSINITGGTAPYSTSFNVDAPANYVLNQTTFNNISGGADYFIYVLDANNCSTNVFVQMNAPVTMTPTFTIDYNCTTSSALINNTVTIGVEANILSQVQYSLDNTTSYQNNNVYTNLSNGNHTIYIKHNNGCIKTVSFTITNYIPLHANSIASNVICYGDSTGSIVATNVTGGVGPYEYAISPDFVYGSSNTFSNLLAGVYIIKVKDSEGCEYQFSQTITQNTDIIIAQGTILQEICEGDNDGQIEISVTGGIPPYSTSLDNITFVPGQFNFFNLNGGTTYTVYVKDAAGCEATLVKTLDHAVDLHPTATVAYSCIGNTPINSVTVFVDLIYQNDVLYSINGINYQQSNVFNNVAVGNHTVYVLHNNGCLNTDANFTIIQVTPLVLTAVASGLNQITATTTGGTPPYIYIFNTVDYGSNNVFLYDSSGIQVIKVLDSNGCEKVITLNAKFYEIEVPNFFTPTGNGINDGWSPINIYNYKNIITKIFDRYGREIKILGVNDTWDGTYENKPVPTGDYWYLININDNTGRTFVGSFTLYR